MDECKPLDRGSPPRDGIRAERRDAQHRMPGVPAALGGEGRGGGGGGGGGGNGGGGGGGGKGGGRGGGGGGGAAGRGLHSSTFQFNLSRFGHTYRCPAV